MSLLYNFLSENFDIILNLFLLLIVVLFWLISNKWINKRLKKFLEKRDLLVVGREKNFKKLAKNILFIVCCLLWFTLETLLSETFSISKLMDYQLISIGNNADGSPSNFKFTLGTIFYIIFISVLAKLAVSFFRILIYRSTKTKSWIDEGSRYTIVQLSKYFIYSIGIVVAIQGMGIDVTFLIAGSAALFVGIGFGLQSILGDVFSGIILLFDGSIKVGDVVEMPNEEICKVEHIFVRTSQLKTIEGKMIIVPNSGLTKENVVNWSISDKVTRFHIDINVAYGSDTSVVKETLYQCALKHPMVDKKRNILVLLDEFAEYSLKFKVFFWVKNTWEIINIKSDIRYIIDHSFRERGIKIPFPQRDLHLMSDHRTSKENKSV